jgi:16S rRNA (guanine966-N2)-methyltransferase
MRIIGGKYKGRRIQEPKSKDTRPTKDRVREAVFNMIRGILPDIENLSVLDLYAGSGSYGFEALSRGAEKVVFVDSDRECMRCIRLSLEQLNIPDSQVRFIKRDSIAAIEEFGSKGEQFNVIFADPPYNADLAKKTLNTLNQCDILSRFSILIIEHHIDEKLSLMDGFFTLLKEKTYKNIVISVFGKK